MSAPATLYVVATPIGNLADLSPRALAVLKQVDLILAEDTRHSQKLLQHFGIQTPLQSCHEHNEREKSIEVLAHLAQGQSYALISDAGTPGLSDPGAKLVTAVIEAGFAVVPIPGACALITALSASGLSGLPLHFYGFLPSHTSQKRTILTQIAESTSGTLAFYESPHRLLETLEIFQDLWGGDKIIVLAKELTKLYETIKKASIAAVLAWLTADPKRVQGEFVLLLENSQKNTDDTQVNLSLDSLISRFLAHLKLKEAVLEVVELTGLPKNLVYERALALKSNRVE